MTRQVPYLSVALPEEQQGDAVRVPVEIRYAVSDSPDERLLVAAGSTQSWLTAPANRRLMTPLRLLDDLLEARVCGSTVMEVTAYDGVPMWQFLQEVMWAQTYLATELVDALLAILNENPVREIRVVPAPRAVSHLWEHLVRAVGESKGIAVSVYSPQPRSAHEGSQLRRGPILSLVRWIRRRLWWVQSLAAALATKVASVRTGQVSGARARQPNPGRKLLFASFARHWTSNPSDPSSNYDEQFDPILPALRASGWSRFVGVDCPYGPADGSYGERILKAGKDTTWRQFDDYRASTNSASDRSRPFFSGVVRKLLGDRGFVGALSYRDIPLAPALGAGLEYAFEVAVPSFVQALDTAGRMLDDEMPDAVLISYEYGPFGRAMVIEANRRGIPSMGLQHGLINDQHQPYVLRHVSSNPAHGKPVVAIPARTLVWGPQTASVLTNVGHYSPDAVAVTGYWRYDSILPNKDQIRRAFRMELELDESDVVVLVLSSGYDQPRYVQTCLRAIAEIDGAIPLVKLHPSEDSASTLTVIRGLALPDATLVRDRMVGAILAADLVVSQVSTATSEALLLERPVVLADFEGLGPVMEGKPDVRGCIYLTNPEGLSRALQRGFDPDVRRTLNDERESAVADLFYRADGKAASRVAAEMERLVLEFGLSSPAGTA